MRRRLRYSLWGLVGLLLLITGCASNAPLEELRLKAQDDIADLRAFTLTDVEAAQAMAMVRGDVAASTCYPAVLVVLRRAQETPVPIVGVVSAFEAMRLVIRPPQARSQALQVACSALLLQAVADLVKFDVAVAKAVSSGGATLAGDAPGAAVKVIKLLRALGVGVGPPATP